MDADRWLGSTGGRWPCYLPNSVCVDEASAAAATRSSFCWLPGLTTCSPATSATCVVCRPSYIDVTATQLPSSSSSHAVLLKPAAAAAAPEDLGKQINETG